MKAAQTPGDDSPEQDPAATYQTVVGMLKDFYREIIRDRRTDAAATLAKTACHDCWRINPEHDPFTGLENSGASISKIDERAHLVLRSLQAAAEGDCPGFMHRQAMILVVGAEEVVLKGNPQCGQEPALRWVDE